MADKRPCRMCRRWFTRDARVGHRHEVCGSEACQRERSRQASAAWRRRCPEKVEAGRLRARLMAKPGPPPAEVARSPMAKFSPWAVRHAVGGKGLVVLEEFGKVLAILARHGVPWIPPVEPDRSGKVLAPSVRMLTDAGPAPP